MRYLNTDHLLTIGIDWNANIKVIHDTVKMLYKNDYSQPIKPYLRFGDRRNRIIAMPAYIGGESPVAGIKWISSFPGNRKYDLPRAHSVSILNSCDTGKPVAIFNTALISGIRTASVSGLVIQRLEELRKWQDVIIGIVGFGPIGQLHLKMLDEIMNSKIKMVLLYDIAGVDESDIPWDLREKTIVCNGWEKMYELADIFITCTVSSQGYIDNPPKKDSVILNVSLRDFKPEIIHYIEHIVVDSWEEVCRENTDIEVMHKKFGLCKKDTISLTEFICGEEEFAVSLQTNTVMFNPMGMAVFDVAIANHFFRQAEKKGIGLLLD